MKTLNPQTISTPVEGDLLRGQRHFTETYRTFINQFGSGNQAMKTCQHLLGLKWLHSSQVTNAELDLMAAGKKSNGGPRFFIAIGRLNQAVASNEELPTSLPSLAGMQPILRADGEPAQAADLWSAYAGLTVLSIKAISKPDPLATKLAEAIQRLSTGQRDQLFQLLEAAVI